MSELIELFDKEAESIRDDYEKKRNVLSFAEYLEEFAREPKRNLRDSASYLLDAIDYYGTETVERPWGPLTRYRIFDQEFADPAQKLVGQEDAQTRLRETIASQVRDGRVNRLVLIHGPNGSAKSTLVKCLFNGLEHYSQLPEGVLYRFRWVFPTRKTSHGSLGFGSRLKRDNLASFAHIDDNEIDSTLECEVRDNPLLLLPVDMRLALIRDALKKTGDENFQIPKHFEQPSLCHRCKQVADALTRTHVGDIRKMLAHVQVEKWVMSRRYKQGIVLVGPQMSVDAAQRQITSDRSFGALPTDLQNMTLFESYGPLVDGSGGIVEFEDMLKRPLDAFKYLLGTIESGEASLGQAILKSNCVLLATTNDDMLEAFRDHHEYPSFRDRISTISVPYITQVKTEAQIYDLQLVPHVDRHVAPHAVTAAAHFAILSRLHKPDSERYGETLKEHIAKLTVMEKADLYENGQVPERLSNEESAELYDAIYDLRTEDASSWSYEGRYGASPRLIRQVLLKASLSTEYECLSPFAVLENLKTLTDQVREHPFLEREVQEGGYHDVREFIAQVEDRVLDALEVNVRTASGLVEEKKYLELMGKYVVHVSQFVKGEKVESKTGDDADPDDSMMSSVEKKIGVTENNEEFRKEFISRIAAWALDHPGQKVDITIIFPKYIRRLKEAYFEEHRQKVAKIARYALTVLTDEDESVLEKKNQQAGESLIANLEKNAGYCKECARVGLAKLFFKRFDNQK